MSAAVVTVRFADIDLLAKTIYRSSAKTLLYDMRACCAPFGVPDLKNKATSTFLSRYFPSGADIDYVIGGNQHSHTYLSWKALVFQFSSADSEIPLNRKPLLRKLLPYQNLLSHPTKLLLRGFQSATRVTPRRLPPLLGLSLISCDSLKSQCPSFNATIVPFGNPNI